MQEERGEVSWRTASKGVLFRMRLGRKNQPKRRPIVEPLEILEKEGMLVSN